LTQHLSSDATEKLSALLDKPMSACNIPENLFGRKDVGGNSFRYGYFSFLPMFIY
jgi:hypothetical protein